MLSEADLQNGFHQLGLNPSSYAIVHSSLRSFGQVEGGANTVCKALFATGANLLFPAGSGDRTGIPAPPGLLRPHNAPILAASWPEFDEALRQAVPFNPQLPIDKELGIIPETIRRAFPHVRSPHPLMSYLATGSQASAWIAAQTLTWPLGPLEWLAAREGDVLLIGVDHTSNTMIHLAEQRLGRSRFYRYAKVDECLWMEYPNIPGESHRFDEIEPHCRAITQEIRVGSCKMRRIPVRELLAVVERIILADPGALLCPDEDCRCGAALQQRLAVLAKSAHPAADGFEVPG